MIIYPSSKGLYVYHIHPQNVTLTYELRTSNEHVYGSPVNVRATILIDGSESATSELEEKILFAELAHRMVEEFTKDA